MVASEAALSSLPYISFLGAYPHPAFISLARSTSDTNVAFPSLHPVFGNQAFRYFINASEQDPLGVEFVECFLNSQDLRDFGTWLHDTDEPSYVLELSFPGSQEETTIQLDVTKTRAENFWVCVTLPRTKLPRAPSPPGSSGDRKPLSRLQRASPGLLPHFPGKVDQPKPVASTPYLSPTGQKSEMTQRLEKHDWAATLLGPREKWSESLVTALSICMSAPHASAVWWTEEAILLYNDKYVDICGSKHPQIYGQTGPVAWAELWQLIGPILTDEVFKGKAVHRENDLLLMHRLTSAKLPEEAYFDWSYRPVINDAGKVEGFLNDAFEVTNKVILKRRTECMQLLATSTILSRSKAEYATTLIAALSRQEYAVDVPFAALYFCETDTVPAAKARHVSKLAGSAGFLDTPVEDDDHTQFITVKLEMAETIAIPDGHPSAPKHLNLIINLAGGKSTAVSAKILASLRDSPPENATKSSLDSPHSSIEPLPPPFLSNSTPSDSSGSTINKLSTAPIAIPWPFADAMQTRQPVHVSQLDDYLYEGLAFRGWNDRPREAVVIPIGLEDEAIPQAMLVLGLNTRRPFDTDYHMWVEHLGTTLSATYKATLARMNDHIRVEQLAEIDAAKTSFFGNISHELKTPLTLIAGPLQEAAESGALSDGALKRNLKMAMRNVRRLERLIGSLMDFSKLAGKKLQGQFQSVKLGIFTTELAASFRSTIEKNGVVFDVSCDSDDEKPDCYVDPDFWEKIVFNILSNAYKYTLIGSIKASVKYNLEANTVSFSVQDTGSGIPTDDLDKIFNRFHRVASVSRSHEGTGIGLSLIKELISLHGGRLDVVSSQDPIEHGSTFTVTLPLGNAHLPSANIVLLELERTRHGAYGRSIVEEAARWTGTSSAPPTGNSDETTESSSGSSSGTGATSFSKSLRLPWDRNDIILVVDDNADMRQYLAAMFSRHCRVIEASNGADALELAQQHLPQVILTDMTMQKMNGMQLLEEIRLQSSTSLIPVILTTARVGDEFKQQAFGQGADDFLEKPYKSSEDVELRVHVQCDLGKRRIRLQHEFDHRRKEMNALLELAPVAIFRLNENKSIRTVNPPFYEFTGHQEGNLETWTEQIISPDREQFEAFLEEVYSSNPTVEEEGALLPHHTEFSFGNGHIVQCQMRRVYDGGALGVLTDITELRALEAERISHLNDREALARKNELLAKQRAVEMEQQRQQAENRAHEAEDRRRDQELLIDVTSHELRQPVSAILNCSSVVRTNLSLLRDQLESGREKDVPFVATNEILQEISEDLDALDSIWQCGLAQERIANDVLSLSRLQLNVLRIEPVEFDLVSEIRRIVSIFDNEAKMKKINMTITIGDTFDQLGIRYIMTDRARIAQIITNLISNAIKFTDTSTGERLIQVQADVALEEPAEESLRVSVLSSAEGLLQQTPAAGEPVFVYVSVTDSGPGLQPDDLNMLFQRFQQGSHRHETFGGSGLGLFVSKQLCQLMGGGIAVESVYGHGATFRFCVKTTMGAGQSTVGPPGVKAVPARYGSPPTQVSKVKPREGGRKPTVMIVEDNNINQAVLNRQLKFAGCETILANNGLQALELLREHTKKGPVDLVLMDVEMPVMDGLTAVQEIRKMEASGEVEKGMNVVALTGNAREGQVQKIWEAGMNDVLIKPYRIGDILRRLD